MVRLERHLERARHELARAREEARCELGDVFEYRRSELARTGHARTGQARAGQGRAGERGAEARAGLDEIAAAMEGLRPGDVLALTARKPGGLRSDDMVAVISKSQRKKGDVRLRAVTAGRRLISLVPRDFRSPPAAVDRVVLPAPYDPKSKEFRRRVATALARSAPGPEEAAVPGPEPGPRPAWATGPGAGTA